MFHHLLLLLLIITSVFIIQLIAIQFTKAKKWSHHAFIRNLLIGFCIIYQTYFGLIIWILPIIAEIVIEYFNYKGMMIDKVSTDIDYLYSDFFEAFTGSDQSIRYFTEGDFSQIPNFPDTRLLSSNDIHATMKFGKKQIEDNYSTAQLDKIMDKSQINKYDWLIKNLGLTKEHKVLEIGFGKGDLLKYMRLKGINCSGISVSIEQVLQMKKLGFDVYHLDFWEIPNLDKLHNQFDAIILNGVMEYFLSWEKNRNIYKKVFSIIRLPLNKELKLGKVAITCVHHKHPIKDQSTWYDKWMMYCLMLGNAMSATPYGKHGLIQYAKLESYHTLIQENRVLDYYLYSRIMSCIYKRERLRIAGCLLRRSLPLLIAHPHFIHNTYAYTGFGILSSPWNWQFTANKHSYIPADHYWLILKAETII